MPAEAARREMTYVDATCPLVSKVHAEAQRHERNGMHILLIGHEGHPEVVGTMGQLEAGTMTLIETVADAEAFTPVDANRLAYVTQTTLSVDDTKDIVAALRRRFPQLSEPRKDDICYATTNRQEAVKAIAHEAQLVLVIGAGQLVQLGAPRRKSPNAPAPTPPTSSPPPTTSTGNGSTASPRSASQPAPPPPKPSCKASSPPAAPASTVSVQEVVTAQEDVVFRIPRVLEGV